MINHVSKGSFRSQVFEHVSNSMVKFHVFNPLPDLWIQNKIRKILAKKNNNMETTTATTTATATTTTTRTRTRTTITSGTCCWISSVKIILKQTAVFFCKRRQVQFPQSAKLPVALPYSCSNVAIELLFGEDLSCQPLMVKTEIFQSEPFLIFHTKNSSVNAFGVL